MTTAIRPEHYNGNERVLFMAFELSEKSWKLGFTTGHGQKPRERAIAARDQKRLLDEIAYAKERFGLPETAPVVSCYEAGREGFWLPRFLQAQGITNQVVDSSSRLLQAQTQVPSEAERAKAVGQTIYVPVYSHIYYGGRAYGGKRRFLSGH